MATRKPTEAEIFIRNARTIMRARKMSLAQWASKAGISGRGLRKYLDEEQYPGFPALSALADAAGLTISEMLMDGLTVEMVKTGEIHQLTKNYVASRPRARTHAQKVLVDDLEYEQSTQRQG